MPIMHTEGGGVIHLPYGKGQGQGRVRGLRQGGRKSKSSMSQRRRAAIVGQLSGRAVNTPDRVAAFRKGR